MAHLELLRRAQSQLAAAAFLHRERPHDLAGVAGLAYQAVDLAMKVLTTELDGADAGSHRARMRRTQELVQAKDRDLAFLWEIRQRDFYGDVTAGAPPDVPSARQIQDALQLAARLIGDIDAVLHAEAVASGDDPK